MISSSLRRWARPKPLLALLSAHLLALLALPAPEAFGRAPGHSWRTLESAHFVLHFHEGLYPMAQRSLRSLEEAHRRLVPYFGEGPKRKTQVLLTDHTDDANGSATAFGRPQIVLHAAPPNDLSILGDFDDWVFILVAHEYAHVLHLGTTGGPTDLLTVLFGNLFTTNAMQPRFVVEGLATYQESLFSSGGRMRSALADMYLRADFLEDRVLSLGELSGGPLRWPRGTAWYLYGGSFLSFIAETRGDEAIRAYSQSYGSSILPYLLDRHLVSSAGATFSELFEEWKSWSRLRYLGQQEAIALRGPITEPEHRTGWGGRTGSPRWGPDGKLFYVEASEDRRPRLRSWDVETLDDMGLREIGVTGSIAPLPDGARVLVAKTEVFRSYRTHGDLFLVGRGGEERLTRGLRASEADVSPDGSFAVFVRREAGRSTLCRIDLDEDRQVEILYSPPEGKQIYTPRISPDGHRIAFSQDRLGPGRDLYVLGPGGGPPLALTDDDAIDLQPSWHPDGDKIFFSSERTGIYNIYSISDRGERIQRLTNVVTGAFQPEVSPDGSKIAWTTYTSHGFDVAVAPMSSLQAAEVVAFVSDRPEGGPRLEGNVYPVRDYSPWRHLGPLAWMPYFTLSEDLVLGASVWGRDPVGIHQWSLAAGYQFAPGQPEVGATYSYGNWEIQPSLSVGTSERRVARGVDAFERVSTGALTLSYPFGTVRTSQSLSLGYQASLFHGLRSKSDPIAPVSGVAAEGRAGWGIASFESPPEAVSPEAGASFSILGRLGSQALGGDFDYRILSLQGGAYLRLPWAKHHVLALLGRAGTSSGDLGGRGIFSLGGFHQGGTLLDRLIGLEVLGESVLRGYAPGSFFGDHLVLGTAEYRFPITWLDASPGIFPLWAGKLSGVVFAEAGSAFDSFPIDRLHPSLGAEVRLSFHLGWGALDGALRLGAAWGLDEDQGGGPGYYLGLSSFF